MLKFLSIALLLNEVPPPKTTRHLKQSFLILLGRWNVSPPNFTKMFPSYSLNFKLGRRLGYFLFFLLGGGEWGVRGARNGGQSLIEDPRGGGVLPREEGGREQGLGGCLRRIRGGGREYFFSGPKVRPSKSNLTQELHNALLQARQP